MAAMNARLLRPRVTGFSPQSISGLEGWWDASDSATVTLDGNGNVESLSDKSGKSRTMSQATSNNRPSRSATINGRSVMTFDGSNDYLGTTGTVSFTAWSAFAVVKPASTSGERGILTADPVNAPRGPQIMRWSGTTYQSVGFPTATPIVESPATAAAVGTVRVVSVVQSASALEMWIDNSSNGSTAGGQQAYSCRLGIGVTTWNNLNDAATGIASGDLAEIIYYGRSLSAAERERVQRYLGVKWGTYPYAPPNYADADVNAYINAVEAADQNHLETSVRDAINTFITGCKADGIWSAIKASCILMGARTLSGALVPLVGTAPTNNNFVSGDYNRKTGLLGNGTSKYLNSNRASNADPQDNVHISVYVSAAASNTTRTMIGDTAASVSGQTIINGVNDGTLYTQARLVVGTGALNISGQGNTTGFKGVSRVSSTAITRRSGGVSETVSAAVNSSAPTSETYAVFARTPSSPALYSADRLAFYSIGESLTLSSLDSRLSTLYNAIGVAIP